MLEAGETAMVPGMTPPVHKKAEAPIRRTPTQEGFMKALMQNDEKAKAVSPLVKEPSEQQLQDSKAAEQLMAELMKQAPPLPAEKTAAPGPKDSVPNTVLPVIKEQKAGPWSWTPEQINNFIQNLGDKLKKFGRNAWYYMSGSFIWDRGSKPQ